MSGGSRVVAVVGADNNEGCFLVGGPDVDDDIDANVVDVDVAVGCASVSTSLLCAMRRVCIDNWVEREGTIC